MNEKKTNFDDLFEHDITNAELFLTSEEHAVSQNKELEIRFLEYFIRKAKVKYLLIEHGYGGAMFLNEYLASGAAAFTHRLNIFIAVFVNLRFPEAFFARAKTTFIFLKSLQGFEIS